MLAACGGGTSSTPTTTTTTTTVATTTTPDSAASVPVEKPAPAPAPAEPAKPAEPQNTTDSEIEGVMLNIKDYAWKPIPSLPKGAQVAVLEGTPPFSEPKSFAVVLKFPNNYKIPPHTHLVTERVTVLQGALKFGHGETFDAKAMTELKVGGIVQIPAGHTHYVQAKGETLVQLQGVGPWGIFYINPKDDPRQPAVAKPETLPEHPTDSDIGEGTAKNAADIQWNPGPPSLPAGAQIAVLEGAPPFGAGKSFVMRLKLPNGYKIPVHHHLVTERVTVLAGTLKFGMGDTWKDADMKPIKTGGVVYMPREHKHYVEAQGETIVQLQGVGPWGIIYADPAEDPRNKK